ncbi:RING finger protein [Longispora sp. K20-0274]|uniref:RING finger protein n=1 Tax=Longispora sp. K20-0274 TaxID=3088255 RepID=UPI00399A6F0B
MARKPVPRLDFGDWYVTFPQRGRYIFLPADQLREAREEPPGQNECGLWLGRAESGLSVIIPVRLAVLRGGLPTVVFAVLHHGDQLRLAGYDVDFHEVRSVRVGESSRLIGQECQQCRAEIVRSADIVQCPLCQAAYCSDCWDFLANKRCYSRACNYAPVALTLAGEAAHD